MKDKKLRDEVEVINATKDEWRQVLASVRLDLENKLEAAHIRIEQIAVERDDALRQVVAKTTECEEWKRKCYLITTQLTQDKIVSLIAGVILGDLSS
jgi:hypothetical protein